MRKPYPSNNCRYIQTTVRSRTAARDCMKFTKAKQNRIFQDIVDQVEEAILAGSIEPDQRLPAERELCEQFKASRGTLREALRILEQKGLIEIRLGAGGGAFVRERNGELMAENLELLIRSQEATPVHLLQMLEETEATVAALAAQRATAEDITILKRQVLKVQQNRDEDADQQELFAQADQEIQQEICRIAGNPIYGFQLQSIRVNLERYCERTTEPGGDPLKEKFQNLRMLVYAIGRNDGQLAAGQAREHALAFCPSAAKRR